MYKTYRNLAKLSQDDAANLLHVDRKILSAIENRHRIPSFDFLFQMGEVYGVPEALPNMFCAMECPIRKRQGLKIDDISLPLAVLRVMKELDDASSIRPRLVDIICDGRVTKDEETEFSAIMKEFRELAQAILLVDVQKEKAAFIAAR
ncbi:MAG: helix-turn-helix transcriptional regulator [Bacillota bacterium]